jgi:hypothetical protein
MMCIVAGMTEREYMRGPFWATLRRLPNNRPVVLGVSDRPDEKPDYEMLSSKFGQEYQFFLLNNDAVKACDASGVKLRVLGSIEHKELSIRPTVLLGPSR